MKNLKLSISLLMALALLSACTTVNRTVYQAASISSVTVDTAMTLWGDYVRYQRASGKDVLSQEIMVRDCFNKYTNAVVLLCDAGLAYASNKDAAALTMASAVLAATISDLIATIRIYLPPEKAALIK